MATPEAKNCVAMAMYLKNVVALHDGFAAAPRRDERGFLVLPARRALPIEPADQRDAICVAVPLALDRQPARAGDLKPQLPFPLLSTRQPFDFDLEPDVIVLGSQRVRLADLHEVRVAEFGFERDPVNVAVGALVRDNRPVLLAEFRVGVLVVGSRVVEDRVRRFGERRGIGDDARLQLGWHVLLAQVLVPVQRHARDEVKRNGGLGRIAVGVLLLDLAAESIGGVEARQDHLLHAAAVSR